MINVILYGFEFKYFFNVLWAVFLGVYKFKKQFFCLFAKDSAFFNRKAKKICH